MELTVGSALAHTGFVVEAENVDDLVTLAEEILEADAVVMMAVVDLGNLVSMMMIRIFGEA